MALDVWKDIPGYEGQYRVSNLGSVASLRMRHGIVDRERPVPYLLKPHVIKGYHNVTLYLSRKPRLTRTSRLVLLAFVGPCPIGMEAAHLDGVRSNNELSNLTWATHVDNVAHKIGHGTHQFGERHPRAILTEWIVLEIRKIDHLRSNYHYGQTALARKYGVSLGTLNKAIRGKSWRHLAL